MELILSKPYIQIYWDPSIRAVYWKWTDFCTGPPRYEALQRILDTQKAKGATRFLADVRQMPVVSAEDEAWSATYFQPVAMDSGLKAFCVIVKGANLFTQNFMKGSKVNFDGRRVLFQFYDSEEEARAWLAQFEG